MVDFEFLEHTADIAVRVYAPSMEDLFISSAKVMFGIITDYESSSVKKRNIYLEAKSCEDLLVYWLNELLSLFYSYNFLPYAYNIKIGKKTTKEKKYFLKGEVEGEIVPSPEVKTEVKAATYHDIKIEKNHERFKVDIVFDV